MSTPIRHLLELITASVETLEAACESPSVAAEAARIIAAAALQLEAIVTPPQVSLYRIIGGHFKSAALRICLESGVTEILREAGPHGLHVRDIAAKNGQDPEKLARFIRYLATHHVYREVKPNVFANTRISSMLDTMKPSTEILADPEHKHDGTMGLAALASHHLDEPFKASAYAWETLADPTTARSGDPTASPFARALGRAETLWEYHARPEEAFRRHRFGIGMQGIEALQPPNAILMAYDWASLAPESLVVDVGGGVGTSCLTLAAKFPDLKFVVRIWKESSSKGKSKKMPRALASGQITLQAHDFFTSQPQSNATVFLLKQIMHDWSDEYCIKILTRLWVGAVRTTTLLLLDSILPLACHDPAAEAEGGLREAPAPLLANYGAANEMGYNADFDMFLLFNSQERTRMHFVDLLARTGWEVVAVHRQPGDSTFIQCIEAKKVVA
ncbi:S-adenosyl-L-methionine-dependent methyltransferase [Mycena leptocephala]|nr:S-adenosyl-L-methionine-dependent methyltransferase [Mycena leptocephala]